MECENCGDIGDNINMDIYCGNCDNGVFNIEYNRNKIITTCINCGEKDNVKMLKKQWKEILKKYLVEEDGKD